MHIITNQGCHDSININPLIEDRGSEVVADSDQSLEKLK
jgi:hypothetical protein